MNLKLLAALPELTKAPGIEVAIAIVALAGMTMMAFADPLSTSDGVITSILILDKYRADFSEQLSEAELRAVGDAAWHELWDALDKEDSAHHEDNAHKANSQLNA